MRLTLLQAPNKPFVIFRDVLEGVIQPENGLAYTHEDLHKLWAERKGAPLEDLPNFSAAEAAERIAERIFANGTAEEASTSGTEDADTISDGIHPETTVSTRAYTSLHFANDASV